jgi:hypothetical protein
MTENYKKIMADICKKYEVTPDIKRMKQTVANAKEFPDNYNSKSQLKMLEKFRYLLNISDKLDLHSEAQKKNIIQTRITLNKSL